MAPIDDIAKIITEAIRDALVQSEAELTRIAEAGGKQAGPGTLQNIGSIFSILESVVTTAILLADPLTTALGVAKTVDDAAGDSGRSFGLGYLLGSAGFQALTPVLLPVNHAIADAAQTEIFDPATAAMLQAKGIIDDTYGRSEAAGGNLSGEHYDKLVDATQERPDVGQVLDAWLKDLVSEDDVNAALQHHQIPQFWWGPLKALKRQFLSPADLALSNLRGEITDDTMEGYAAQLGVTADDMAVLIGNTGEPPGIEQMLFLYRRELITKDDLVRAIKQSRIRNEWIPAVEALAHEPMSTADAARAVVEGYMAKEDGAVIAAQNGLDPDHWPIILESWGRPLSHEQMLTLYHRGQATRDDVVTAMKQSDIKDQYIEQAIDLGRRLVPERLIVQMLGKAVIDHPTAHTMLVQQGFNDDDAEALINLGAATRLTAAHALTRTDLVAMYEDSLLTRAEVTSKLTALGFTNVDATALLDLADTKLKAATLRTVQRSVEASLKIGHLTQQQAINQLETAGVSSTQAHGLVDQWMQVKGAVTRSLTEAQIIDLGEAQLIQPNDVLTRLQGYGLSQGDAELLMQLKGIPLPGSGSITVTGSSVGP